MSTRNRKLSRAEIKSAVSADGRFPSIITLAQLGQLSGVKLKTLYAWIAEGRLDGAFRKRGKHHLVWRDRAIDILFNGPDWKKND